MVRVQKILLIGISLPAALYPIGAILESIFKDQGQFQYTMIIGFVLSIIGIVSFIFHLKSFQVYRLYKKNKSLPKIEPIFWWINLVFALACLQCAVLLTYIAYRSYHADFLWRMMVVIILIALLGFWTLIDAFLLNRIYKIHQFNNRYSEMEEIKGR